jgi:hypothetical protein
LVIGFGALVFAKILGFDQLNIFKNQKPKTKNLLTKKSSKPLTQNLNL